MMHKKQRKQNKMSSILKGLQLNELSNKKLGDYKIAAGADASKADSEGDYKRGNKRMSGIIKATKKEFANDTKGLAEDWDSIPDKYKNDIERFKKLFPGAKADVLAKAHIIKTDGHSHVITKGEKWDNFWKRNEPIEIKTPYAKVDFDAIYKKAKHDYAVLHSNREDELGMGAAGRRELQQRAEELAEMKRVTLRNERLHDEEVAFQRAETIQQRKDEMKKIADKYNHELAVINTEHSNNMQAIKTGNNHEINKMNMEYKHEKEMWDKNNPQEKPEYDDEEYVKPQQSGNKFDQDTGKPIKPNKPQQSNQWHTSQQLTSPTKPTKPGKEDDDVTDVEPKPNKPLALGNNVKEAGPGIPFRGVGGAFNRGDDERHDLDTPKQPPQIWGLKINGKVWQKNGKYVTFNSKEAALNIRNSILKNRPDLQIGLVTQDGTSTSPAPTKPAPQKPLMAVSMDRWKEAVLKRYPEAKFMTQKMINGATIAMDKTGQVGIYDPKNSYAKVGPETQGVAKPMNEGVPSDNDMGVVPDVRSGTSTKMTLGQWKQMWLKKMPHADQGMFRYPPAMKGSFIAYFDGWENTPGARWDPQQSVSEEQLDELKCWSGYHRVAGTKAGFPGSCAKNKTNEEGVAEGYDPVESDYQQWEDILVKDGYRGDPSGAYALELVVGHQLMSDPAEVASTIRNILTYVKQNRQVLGKAVSDRKTVKDAIIDIKNKFPQQYQAAQQPQGVAEEQHSCPHCGGEMVSEELMNEKKDACYYKVKSRYKVWPSAYASGALVKCRNKGAKNWGNSSKNESSILEGIERADESLHDWFNKEKWVRMDTKGKIKGPCAKEPGEGKPKCLPQAKAHSLGKKGRASAAQRKRREDPNPERSGKAINVNTKKSNENVDEDWKKKLGAAALTGAMALGAAGANADTRRVTPDGQGGFTGGFKPSPTVVLPSDNKPAAEAPNGFSKEYLLKAADPNRTGKYLLRVEKAQELLKQRQGQ